MDEIITERSGNILRVELNRPAKRNAMTSRMYVTLADVLKEALTAFLEKRPPHFTGTTATAA
jgi:enoyl-CoA hydratase/carnithine racemase